MTMRPRAESLRTQMVQPLPTRMTCGEGRVGRRGLVGAEEAARGGGGGGGGFTLRGWVGAWMMKSVSEQPFSVSPRTFIGTTPMPSVAYTP